MPVPQVKEPAMTRCCALLLSLGCLALVLALAPGARTGPGETAPAARVRTDLLGDALPPGAVARVGSLRFYHGDDLGALAFSADDRVLYSLGGTAPLRAWETATGKELPPPAGL